LTFLVELTPLNKLTIKCTWNKHFLWYKLDDSPLGRVSFERQCRRWGMDLLVKNWLNFCFLCQYVIICGEALFGLKFVAVECGLGCNLILHYLWRKSLLMWSSQYIWKIFFLAWPTFNIHCSRHTIFFFKKTWWVVRLFSTE
jgi:hypothetical protein